MDEADKAAPESVRIEAYFITINKSMLFQLTDTFQNSGWRQFHLPRHFDIGDRFQ